MRYAEGWLREGAIYRRHGEMGSGAATRSAVGIAEAFGELWPWLLVVVVLAWAVLGFVSQ